MPVPDDPPTMDSFDVRANHAIFVAALTATRAFVGHAMHEPACEWLGTCVTTAIGALRALVSMDTGKRARFIELEEGLRANGWSASKGVYTCVSGDTMPTAAKNAKILKSASALAEAYVASASPAGGLDGSPMDAAPSTGAPRVTFARELVPATGGEGQADGEVFDGEDLIGDDALDAYIQGGPPPTYVTGVTAAALAADPALVGRADAVRGGETVPLRGRFAHQTASGSGFDSMFGCGTYDFGEARVFQECPRTRAVISVPVGQKRSHEGLVLMYNDEYDRLFRAGHPHAAVLRSYITWLMTKIVRHAASPDLMTKLIAFDTAWRQKVGRDGLSFEEPLLNSEWGLVMCEAAHASAGRAAYPTPGGHGGRGGGGGHRGGYGRQRGARNPGRAPPPGIKPACRDFTRGNCARGAACRFGH